MNVIRKWEQYAQKPAQKDREKRDTEQMIENGRNDMLLRASIFLFEILHARSCALFMQ